MTVNAYSRFLMCCYCLLQSSSVKHSLSDLIVYLTDMSTGPGFNIVPKSTPFIVTTKLSDIFCFNYAETSFVFVLTKLVLLEINISISHTSSTSNHTSGNCIQIFLLISGRKVTLILSTWFTTSTGATCGTSGWPNAGSSRWRRKTLTS